jgi:hypothetical protein
LVLYLKVNEVLFEVGIVSEGKSLLLIKAARVACLPAFCR